MIYCPDVNTFFFVYFTNDKVCVERLKKTVINYVLLPKKETGK